jgi:hypothetical protein
MTGVSAICERFNAQSARGKWQAVCDSGLAFESGKLVELLGIWQSVRGDRMLPERTDFTARSLAKHLPNLTFVERVETPGQERRYRFRLFGSALGQYTGDWTGKFLDDSVPPAFQQSWFATYDAAIESGVPLRFVSRFRAEHLHHIQAETLIAPLGDGSGAANGLLISVIYSPFLASG